MRIAELALSPAAPARLTRVVFGQPTEADLGELARAGVRVLLDLRQVDEDRGFDEDAASRAAGLVHRSLPIAGPAGLTPENVREFARIVDDPANHPLAAHCATANRIGALVALKAAWLDGLEPEAALDLGRQAGMVAIEPAVRALLAGPP